MPIYEYHCTGCNHHFDVLQKMSDEPVAQCPKCAANKVQRLVSAAGFQLKGSGWYATDFKSQSGAAPSSENKSESKTGKETKSDTSTTSSTGE